MNLSEAKKFLNDKGYLLEDRFGGGKDRYGHKIKRLKLSDLDNEDLDNEDEPLPTGEVEPSDLEPKKAPTEYQRPALLLDISSRMLNKYLNKYNKL